MPLPAHTVGCFSTLLRGYVLLGAESRLHSASILSVGTFQTIHLYNECVTVNAVVANFQLHILGDVTKLVDLRHMWCLLALNLSLDVYNF